MDGGELLTVADAAVRLDRSTEQVRRYLREGRLNGRRIGGQWFIEQQALQTFGEQKRDARAFLDRIASAAESDPLGSTIGIAAGGGSNLADGKKLYSGIVNITTFSGNPFTQAWGGSFSGRMQSAAYNMAWVLTKIMAEGRLEPAEY